MNRQLYELDSFYKNAMTKLSAKQRISYCEQLVDKMQNVLMYNASLLTENTKEQLKQVIRAAQAEIRVLLKQRTQLQSFGSLFRF